MGAAAVHGGHRPPEAYEYEDSTKELWHNAPGFPLFVELLNPDPSKTRDEQLTEARLRPFNQMQIYSLLWDMLADKDNDNAAPEHCR